jgi:hypothetical protein
LHGNGWTRLSRFISRWLRGRRWQLRACRRLCGWGWRLSRPARSRRFASSPFGESAVGGHETREHWRDESGRFDIRLQHLAGERFGIGNKIAMDGGRELDRQLDRLVVLDRHKLEFCHQCLPHIP